MRVDVLCQCGWGRLGIEEIEVPPFCPRCGFPLAELGERFLCECEVDNPCVECARERAEQEAERAEREAERMLEERALRSLEGRR